MNLYRVLTSPAFDRAVREMAKHWPASLHPNCLPARLAARLMFGDDEEEHRKQAAKALDSGQFVVEEIYDHSLDELLPELTDLAEVYDVPLADVAQAALAMAQVYWRPKTRLLIRNHVMQLMGFKDPSMRRLEKQGRVPPPIHASGKHPIWTEPAIEGWIEVVEANRKLPYHRGFLIYPPYDGKKLSEYTTQKWLEQKKRR